MAELKLFKGGSLGKWWAGQSKTVHAAIELGVPAAGLLAYLHRKSAGAAPAANQQQQQPSTQLDPSQIPDGLASTPTINVTVPPYGSAPAASSGGGGTLSAHQLHLLHLQHIGATANTPPHLSPHQAHLLHLQHEAHVGHTGG